MIKVDKDVPVPTSYFKKYPFDEMEVGDSFFYQGDRNTVAAAAGINQKRSGRKYSVLKFDGGFRVWRIA